MEVLWESLFQAPSSFLVLAEDLDIPWLGDVSVQSLCLRGHKVLGCASLSFLVRTPVVRPRVHPTQSDLL